MSTSWLFRVRYTRLLKMQWLKAILDEMFREFKAVCTPPAHKGSGIEILNISQSYIEMQLRYLISIIRLCQCLKYSKLNIPPNKKKDFL